MSERTEWFVAYCQRCGRERTSDEMAFIDLRAFCHPSTSVGATCYMLESHGVPRDA